MFQSVRKMFHADKAQQIFDSQSLLMTSPDLKLRKARKKKAPAGRPTLGGKPRASWPVGPYASGAAAAITDQSRQAGQPQKDEGAGLGDGGDLNIVQGGPRPAINDLISSIQGIHEKTNRLHI